MLVVARIFPTKLAPAKTLAEAVVTQYTPTFEPAFIRLTTEPAWAVSELPTRKTKATLLWPRALRVSVPFRLKVDALEYTAGSTFRTPERPAEGKRRPDYAC